MLDSVRAEDEVGEGLVGDELPAGAAGLNEVDDRGRIFGRGVLVALKREVQEQPGRRVAFEGPALGSVDQGLAAAHEILGQLVRALQKRIGFDVGDVALRGLTAADKRESRGRCGGAKGAQEPVLPPYAE